MKKTNTFDSKIKDFLDEDALEKTIITADNPYEEPNCISTGSFSLDLCTGIGGVPTGRFTVVDGLEASGKSTVATTIAKNCILSTGRRSLYVETENQLNVPYTIKLLEHPEWLGKEFVVAKPSSSDIAFNLVESAIRSGEFGNIVIDSVAGLAPQEELDKDFEKANMAIIPRDLAHFFRRNVFPVRTNKVAVVFINQLRDNIGAYVKSYVSPGGHALNYYSSLTINLRKMGEIKFGDETVGISSKFIIKKNKVGVPFRSFDIPIIFGKGIDYARDAVAFAETLGVVDRAGAFYKFDGETLGRGMNAVVENLEHNPDILQKIKDKCLGTITSAPIDEESKEELNAE